jgi:hypothetical protein
MEHIVHSHHRIIESTFLKKILNEHNLEPIQIRLRGFCRLDLLSGCWTTDYCSHFVACFEGGDQGPESEVAICASNLNTG